jgi:hypothetical protein
MPDFRFGGTGGQSAYLGLGIQLVSPVFSLVAFEQGIEHLGQLVGRLF